MKKTVFILAFLSTIFSISFAQTQFNDFENSVNLDVLIEPGNDTLWQIGPPAKTLFDEARSLPNAILTDSVNTYPIDQSTWFEIELDDNTTYSWPFIQIGWQYKADMEQGVDGGIIEASYDNGQTYRNIFSDPDFVPEIVGSFETDTLFNGEVGITGTTDDWQWMAICWGTYNGTLPIAPDFIQIRYTFVSDSTDTQQEGWMMDNFITEIAVVGSTTNRVVQPMKVFPNPTVDALYFELDEINDPNAKIMVYNNAGQLVIKEKLDLRSMVRQSISTKNLPAGMYKVLIETEDDTFQASFVKSK